MALLIELAQVRIHLILSRLESRVLIS